MKKLLRHTCYGIYPIDPFACVRYIRSVSLATLNETCYGDMTSSFRSAAMLTEAFILRYDIYPSSQSELVHLIMEECLLLHEWLGQEEESWKTFTAWRDDLLKERGLERADSHLELARIQERPIAGRPRSDFDLVNKPGKEEAIRKLENWQILPNKRYTIIGK